MMRQIFAQTVASTHLDSQGEQLSVDDLVALLRGIPPRIPLHQHHDFSLPVCGEMTNFRIEPDPDDPAHSFLICDVTYDDGLVDASAGGAFSWSATRGLLSNSEDPEFAIYFPFPHYNSQDLLQAVLQADTELVVGKWLKKNADPWLIALIVIVLRPFWETTYKKLLEEKVGRLIDALRSRWPKGMSINVAADVPTELYSPRPTAILLPPKDDGLDGLRTAAAGVERAKEFCEQDFESSAKKIRRMRLIYDANIRGYRILGVEYEDGSHTTLEKE